MSNNPAISSFLATWLDEFGRAAEMFSGAAPVFSPQAISELPDLYTAVWYRQTFSSEKGKFTTWIAAPQPTLTDLGSADPENPQSIYLEMVGQAQTGAATVASRSVASPISADAGELVPADEFDRPASYALFAIDIDNGRLPALLYAVELNAPSVLSEASAETPALATGPSMPAVPEPLLDIELPVAISLGHAEMAIRNVLTLQPGAPIELSTENGEELELLVQGTVIARGEITMVKGNYALKIKQIVGAEDRLSLLKR